MPPGRSSLRPQLPHRGGKDSAAGEDEEPWALVMGRKHVEIRTISIH
jgi:hypothetical protein